LTGCAEGRYLAGKGWRVFSLFLSSSAFTGTKHKYFWVKETHSAGLLYVLF